VGYWFKKHHGSEIEATLQVQRSLCLICGKLQTAADTLRGREGWISSQTDIQNFLTPRVTQRADSPRISRLELTLLGLPDWI
jgi:hypothetical protein